MLKYDSSGSLIWTRQTGTLTTDAGFGVSESTDGSVYVAASATGNLNGQPWAGDHFTLSIVIESF